MIRQDIRIGDFTDKGTELVSYKYVVDLLKNGIDIKETVKKSFVMLRKYNVINNIVYDTDLYLIERSLLENHEDIIYPMTNGTFIGFSNNVSLYNNNYDNSHVFLGSDEVYEIYKKNDVGQMEVTQIPCDILRVYHPHNRKELKSILYADVMVNAVKFHILCKPYLSLESHSEEDFDIDGIKYSEYVECYIPDMDWLLREKVYYKEDLCIIDTPHTNEEVPENKTEEYSTEFQISIEHATGVSRRYDESDLDSELILTPFNRLSPDGNEYAAFRIFTIPFYIKEDNGVFSKNYVIDLNDSVEQDYIAYPVRMTIWPYDTIDETTGIYINNTTLSPNSDVMQGNASMSLAAKMGFDDNGVPSLVCTFQFPGKDNFTSFREAYEYYYRVDLNDYEGIVEYEEEDEDDYVDQKQCAFLLSIYTDFNMTSKLFSETFELDNPESQLDDFSFQLSNMFNSYDQLHDILVIQAKFIDKWLGNIITSNPVPVTVDAFKYLVCDDPSGRSIVNWNGKEQTPKHIQDMDLNNINFIDKISCTIRRNTIDNDLAQKSANTPKVLYKPVFYRVADLQNITIHTGVIQNIGVALAEYMTKVESFKMRIGDLECTETARNDIYVIFPVNGSAINVDSGTYHITNQDGELISSGQFNVIA